MSTNVAEVDVEIATRDGKNPTVRARFDGERTPASMAVIAALADVMELDPLDLGPIYPTIDPEALDLLLDAGKSTDICVTFPHGDHVITVRNSGVITMTPESKAGGAGSDGGTEQ